MRHKNERIIGSFEEYQKIFFPKSTNIVLSQNNQNPKDLGEKMAEESLKILRKKIENHRCT